MHSKRPETIVLVCFQMTVKSHEPTESMLQEFITEFRTSFHIGGSSPTIAEGEAGGISATFGKGKSATLELHLI